MSAPKPTTMKQPITEERLQALIVKWWDANCERLGGEPPDLVHIPNGLLTESARRRCLALGVRPGFPDLFLTVPRGKYHGMFLELKRPGRDLKGGLSSDQFRMLRRLKKLGYACFAVNDFVAATTLIANYMELL